MTIPLRAVGQAVGQVANLSYPHEQGYTLIRVGVHGHVPGKAHGRAPGKAARPCAGHLPMSLYSAEPSYTAIVFGRTCGFCWSTGVHTCSSMMLPSVQS